MCSMAIYQSSAEKDNQIISKDPKNVPGKKKKVFKHASEELDNLCPFSHA